MGQGTFSQLGTRWVALLAAVASASACAYLVTARSDERTLARANAAGRAGDYARAASLARTIGRAPTAPRARLVEAYAELALGHTDASLAAFAAAANAAPNDWTVRRGWAYALLASGRTQAAARQMARAVSLNPGLSMPAGFRR